MKTNVTPETSLTLTGLFENMSNEAYHQGPGYSATELITMADGFDVWKWRKTQPRETTDAMNLGSATHLLLEAHVKNDLRIFQDGIAILPELNMRTKDGKAAYEEFVKLNAGKLNISVEDHDLARRMVDAVMREPEIVGYFQRGISEPSVFVKDEETGLLLKCRPDYLRAADGLSVNFKTTRPDVSFERQAAIMAYDWASSFYCDVLRQHFGRNFDEIHVSVTKEKDGPCRVHLNTIDDDDLNFARAQWRALLSRIPECERTGLWPAPPVSLQAVKIPNFARRICHYV